MRFCLSAKCDEEREELELLKINNNKLKSKLEEYLADKLRYKEQSEQAVKESEEAKMDLRVLEVRLQDFQDKLSLLITENQRLNKAFHESTDAYNKLSRGEARKRGPKKKSSVHSLDKSEASLNPLDMFSMFVTGLNKKPR